MTLAFSTSSSAACIPLSLKTLKEEFNVEEKVSSFTIPLGATINMDGTVNARSCNCIYSSTIQYSLNKQMTISWLY